MSSTRAPLFSVSLAFAIGCLLAIDGIASLSVALALFLVAGMVWAILRRHEQASLVAFYGMTVCGGMAHALLVSMAISHHELRALPDEKGLETTQWRGVVIEEPSVWFPAHPTRRTLDRLSFVLRVEAWRPTGGRLFGAAIDVPWQPACGELRCTVLGPASDIVCGDRLEFATALIPVAPPLSPGELDYRAYEAERGIYYHATIAARDWQRIETGGGDFWKNLSFQARDWAYARLQIGLEDDPRMADFLAGMLIGYRQEIPTDIQQDFRRTGTLHVFAVSGQNIAEMVVVALVLLQLCGLVRWRWAWTIAPLILLYCLLTGSPSSAVRATAMALTILLAWRLGRPLHALACWSLAFLAMSIYNPLLLLDPGAQLSFGIVLGLILLGPPITRFLTKPFQPDAFLPVALLTRAQRFEKRFWWMAMGLLGSGLAATVINEPITAMDFHQITPISILANLVVVPLAGLITMVGTLSIALSLLSTPLVALLNNANWLFAKVLILFVGFMAHEPDASFNVPDLATIGSPKPLFVVVPLSDSAGLLVRTATQTWLVNAGPQTPTSSATWHLLQYYGVNRLDGLILAQMSGPDNGGAEAIVRDFHPKHLIVPILRTRSPVEKIVPELAALCGHKVETWQKGQTLNLDASVQVEVLSPSADSLNTRAEDRALVLLFRVSNQTLLWAGRLGTSAQQNIVVDHPDLRADVLVMGTEAFPEETWFRALQVRDWLQIPRWDRQANHPARNSVSEFCRVWALDRTGAVTLYFQAKQNNQPAKVFLRPWLAEP